MYGSKFDQKGDKAFSRKETINMNAKKWMLLVLGLGLMVALVGCGTDAAASDAKDAETMSPEEVTREFYAWYIDYTGRSTGEFRNPLVDRAYRSSEHLSESFVQKVDELLDSFDQMGYDPFLCAQDIPERVTVGAAQVEGDTAHLIVETSFGKHVFNVELQRSNQAWQINNVVCSRSEADAAGSQGPPPAETTPAEAVNGFYGWYLSYARNQGNPLVDGAYQSSQFLTQGLVQKVDGIVASFDRGGFDPFLCAQDIPDSVSLDEPVVSGDVARVTVHTSFEDHAFTVALQRTNGRWLMSDVLCEVDQPGPGDDVGGAPAEPSTGSLEGWQTFTDAEYGFALSYPPDWTVKELEADGPGVPEDWPVVRVMQFFPSAWAEALSGSPDPNGPPAFAPLSLEVCVGPWEQFRRVYIEPSHSESLVLGGEQVTLEREVINEQISLSRYVFQEPGNPDVRVVLIDYVSGFPDRAAGNEAIIDQVGEILETFQFQR